jgi:hypothetical protein
VSIIHPKFLTVPTADSDRYGFLGAHLLALIHYANQLPDERNGRLLIDGAMWWQVSYADLAASVGGGVKRDSVWRKVAELESAGRLMSCMPGCEPGSSKADTTKAYRVPDTTSEPSDQSFRTGRHPFPPTKQPWPVVSHQRDRPIAPARRPHRTSATTPSHQRETYYLLKNWKKRKKGGGTRAQAGKRTGKLAIRPRPRQRPPTPKKSKRKNQPPRPCPKSSANSTTNPTPTRNPRRQAPTPAVTATSPSPPRDDPTSPRGKPGGSRRPAKTLTAPNTKPAKTTSAMTMSNESKPADPWQHVFAASHDRPSTWCTGCGYHRVVHGTHRADCTARDSKCCRVAEPVRGQHL